jgi:hypothetical protein
MTKGTKVNRFAPICWRYREAKRYKTSRGNMQVHTLEILHKLFEGITDTAKTKLMVYILHI